jgi:deazaflavin-dependent oxidoreductase (nitroreductase family)
MLIAGSIFSFFAILLILIVSVRFCGREVAAFHRIFTNRIAIRFAGRLPGFAILTSVGYKSGRVYRTPVNVFRESNGFLIALTYGRNSGWVKNVLSAGNCRIETCGVQYQLSSPVVVHDPTRRRFPPFVRVILGFIAASDFLELSASDPLV